MKAFIYQDGQNAVSEKQTPVLQYHKNLKTCI